MKKFLNFLKKIFINNITERIAITFLEGFLTVILAINLDVISNVDDVKKLVLSAIAMGVSATWNLAVKPILMTIVTKLKNKINSYK